jgi:hypothetical protein
MKKTEEKIYAYRGTAMMVFLLLMYLFILVFPIVLLYLISGQGINWQIYLYGIVLIPGLFVLFGLLCLYNITITIDDTYFSFKLGIGCVKKRYEIANIKSCKPYSGIHTGFGVGIKKNFSGDVLKQYNVTGKKAIELRLYDNNAIIKIGTPQPEEISQYVQSLMEKNRLKTENKYN